MNESTKPHSKLGIASCVIGLITFLIFLLAMVFWLIPFWCSGCSQELKDQIILGSLTVMLLVPIPAHIVGLILGTVSLFFPNRKKLFPILGVVLNLIFAALGAFPILLGMVLAA
jgi:phage-related protein